MSLTEAEVAVLDELRERSDEQHETEYVTSEEFPRELLWEMSFAGLVRIPENGPVLTAWITKDGISALLSHEKGGRS